MGTSAGSGSQSGRSEVATLNPSSIIFGQALGIPAFVGDRGGLMFGRSPRLESNLQLANQSFTPSSFDALGSLAQPMNPFNLDVAGVANQFGSFAQDLFSDTLLPASQELASTGFRTSIDPAIALSKFTFENDFLPAAAQQFGSMGLSPGDSDFGAAIAREAGRRSNELGALDIQLQEAASGRRAAGLPLAAQMPAGLADSLFGLDASSRQAARAQTPGGQLFDLLMNISGMNTQGQSTQQSSGSDKNFGANLV